VYGFQFRCFKLLIIQYETQWYVILNIRINPLSKLLMIQNYDKLMLLLYSLPEYNTSITRDKLSDQISDYKAILDLVNQTNDDYNRNTNVFYSGINAIERNLYHARQAKTDLERDQAFMNAVKALKSYIKALSAVIKPHDYPSDLQQIKSKHEFVDNSLVPKNHFNVK